MKAAFAIFASLVVIGSAAAEAPPTTLKVVSTQRGSALKFSFRPETSASGCEYALFAGSSTARVQKAVTTGSPIIALAGRPSGRSVFARSLPRIRSRSSTVPFYFQSRTSCGNESSLSNRVRVDLPAGSNVSAVKGAAFQKQLGNKLLLATVTFRQVFSSLELTTPLDLQPARDGTGRIFIVEQGGRIVVATPNGTPASGSEFIDISSRISSGGERGLLGLALHPNFAQNGYFYLNYTRPNGDTHISRFSVDTGDPNRGDPNSEIVLLHIVQPFANHNGGGLAFGNDGYLYIGLGDGGSGGDPFGYAQDRTSLLGKFLRIDVDTTSNGNNYGVPQTNPYVGSGSGFREEIFAYGVRNPFRFSVDAATGDLWAGDVGQNEHEEIDVIESGKNYGWNTMEGNSCYEPSTGCDQTGLTLPITDYDHDIGQSVTGGYVYRGSGVPALRGRYIYGDFITGRIFALDAGRRTDPPIELADSSISIASFGQDSDNELYIVGYDGRIYRFTER